MSQVTYTAQGHVGKILLNRPEAMNTMTSEFLEDALSAFETAIHDESTSVLILTGAGRAFCAGGDLSRGPGGAVSGAGTYQEQTDRLRRFMNTSAMLRESPKIVLAAINGACAGAGLSWACAADLRVASSKARFNTAFVNAGLSGDFGGTWFLPRLIGASLAAEKYLLSEPFDASEALRIGLVAKVFEPASFDEEVEALAQRLAQGPKIALRYVKENLRDSASASLEHMLDIEAARHTYCALTEDASEAADAFISKRPAQFKE